MLFGLSAVTGYAVLVKRGNTTIHNCAISGVQHLYDESAGNVTVT
jgi:hypothetical protein